MKVVVHAILVYAGVEVQLHLFVTSALGGGEQYLHALATVPGGKSPTSYVH